MQLIRFLVILIVFSSLFSCATQKKPIIKTPSPTNLVNVSGNYQKIYQVEDLPSVISDYFKKPRFEFDMVGPEGVFSSSRGGSKLVNSGNGGEIWFIEFWMGGAGLSQTFLSFRVKDNKILSIGNVYQGQIVKLTIEELQSRLPTKPECVKKQENYLQHHYEIGYGICPEQYSTKN
jgi:hypothetical protein